MDGAERVKEEIKLNLFDLFIEYSYNVGSITIKFIK